MAGSIVTCPEPKESAILRRFAKATLLLPVIEKQHSRSVSVASIALVVWGTFTVATSPQASDLSALDHKTLSCGPKWGIRRRKTRLLLILAAVCSWPCFR